MKKLLLGLAALLVLGTTLAACGDSPAAPDAAAIPASPEGSGAAATASGGTVVRIAMFRFQPERVEVPVGTTISWENTDQILHTVTAGTPEAPSGRFDEELSDAGTTATVTFEEAGTYPYFCARHDHMRGEVRVG